MRLTTYSWLAVVLAVACVAIGWLGLAGWMAVVVLVASIAMHVAGNALGTALRDATDRDLGGRRPVEGDRPVGGLPLPVLAPSRLERRESLGWLVPVSCGIGAVLGGSIGTMALLWLTSSSIPGAVIGGTSSAVIGALVGFLLASFIDILRTAVRDAIAHERASQMAAAPRRH
jgi:hypothetical protein